MREEVGGSQRPEAQLEVVQVWCGSKDGETLSPPVASSGRFEATGMRENGTGVRWNLAVKERISEEVEKGA